MSSCSPQSYIHGSSQAQFVAESHIILLLSILYVERESVIMQFIQVGWYQRCRQNCFSRIFFFLLSCLWCPDMTPLSILVTTSEWKFPSNGSREVEQEVILEEREIWAVFCLQQWWKPVRLFCSILSHWQEFCRQHFPWRNVLEQNTQTY